MAIISATRATTPLILDQGKSFLYKKGQTIFYEGLRPMGVFYIVSGRVKTSRTSPSGKETMIGITNSGCLLGYNELLNKDFYSYNAVVIEDAEIIFISRNGLFKIMNETPSFLERVQKV